MKVNARIRGFMLLIGVAFTVLAGLATLATPPVEAARCCWVMVCSPAGCWEECRTCPKLP